MMDEQRKAELDAQVDEWARILLEVKQTAEALFADPEMRELWLLGEAGVMVSVHGVRAIRKPADEDPGGYL